MQSPFFSIVIPIYNVALYLDECLESLCAQAETSWEGLCVDDGSKDNSGDILTDWLRKDARLKATFQRNGGLSASRNRALPSVKGEYIGFLDSDDAVSGEWLASARRKIEVTQADLVRFGCCLWRGARPEAIKTNVHQVLTDRYVIQQWGWQTFVQAAFVWRYFVKFSCASKVRFPQTQRVKEDCVYGLRLLPHLTSVCDCDAKFYFYRMRKTSLLHAYSPIEVPIQLVEEARAFLTYPVLSEVKVVKRSALAFFVRQALTDWATRANPADCASYENVRKAFKDLFTDGCFTFCEVFPWHWRPSAWSFLRMGILFPLQLHSFFYRAYLRILG